MSRAKNNDEQTYEQLAERLKANLDEDRRRLSEYLTRLIDVVSLDDERVIIAADAVAKISDSLTKQTHLSIDVMKVVARARGTAKDDPDSIDDEIGRPFKDGSQVDGKN